MDALAYLAKEPLDTSDDTPLYLQLEERILHVIATHALDGRPLPAETEIADALGLSRATVRRCFADLVRDGRVIRRRGKGTFVAPSDGSRGTDVSLNFTSRMVALGKVPTSRVLSLRRIGAAEGVARRLSVDADTPVWEIRRLRLADGEPMEYHVAYVPCRLCEDLSEKDLESSLYARIAEASGTMPASAEATVEAVVLDAAEARLLAQPKGAPALRMLRTTFDATGTPFEAAIIVYRADHNHVGVRMSGSEATFTMTSV